VVRTRSEGTGRERQKGGYLAHQLFYHLMRLSEPWPTESLHVVCPAGSPGPWWRNGRASKEADSYGIN
jgi:hypothetical protein